MRIRSAFNKWALVRARTVRFLLAATALLAGGIGFAVAQVPPQTAAILHSLVGGFSLPIYYSGPYAAVVPLNGGTFTCAISAATVANTNVDAGSNILMTLKTVGGTVAAPFVATITAGTGFTVTCGGSDTSTYNYIILG